MSAPLINPRSEQATALVSRLDYQLAVNRTLLASTRPKGRGPLLSASEMDEMERAYRMGLSAAGFAARLIARDKHAAAVDAYWDDPEFGERRRRAHANNYACPWCGSTVAHCADRECPGDPARVGGA